MCVRFRSPKKSSKVCLSEELFSSTALRAGSLSAFRWYQG
jgi:hypothetical protein